MAVVTQAVTPVTRCRGTLSRTVATSLEFKNLPLNQVDIKLALGDKIDLNVPSAILLRDLYKDSYPVVLNASQFEAAPGNAQVQVDIDPNSVRVLGLGSRPTGLVLIIQNNLLMIRWVRRAEDEALDYPRYGELCQYVYKAFDRLCEGLRATPRVSAVQVVYSNVFDVPRTGASASVRKYLNEQCAPLALDGNVQAHSFHVSWRQEDKTDIRVAYDEKENKGDEDPRVASLTTIAGTFLKDGDDMHAMVDKCHDNVNKLFESILTDEAKAEWGYSNE